MIRVIVTYSWDSEKHKERVISFVDYLRRSGFDAVVDRMLSQSQTAIDFNKMMHMAMTDYPKVVIILSPGYKEKAEGFQGGVGKEFNMVLTDIDHQASKYILASFDGRGRDVAPLAFASREILDLNKEPEMEKLFRKLMDKPELEFAPVATSLPELSKRAVKPFIPDTAIPPLVTIKNLIVGGGTGTQRARLYTRLRYPISVEVINEASQAIQDYAIELHVPKDLVSDWYQREVKDDRAVFDFHSTRPLYSGQVFKTEPIEVEFHHGTVSKVLGKTILVKTFGPGGPTETNYEVNNVFKIPEEYGMPPTPMSIDRFDGGGFF
jgi:hypothetical protein